MKPWLVAVGILGLVVQFAHAEEAAPPKKEAAWQNDYVRAREQARQSGRPVFVVFR